MMSMHDCRQTLALNSGDFAHADDDNAVPAAELKRDRTSHILCPHNVRLYVRTARFPK